MRTLIFLLIVCITSCQTNQKKEKLSDEPQWIRLFNGENLDGWTIRIMGKELNENYANTFRVDSGLLKIRYDQYDNYRTQYGAIYYNNPFTNYRLRMEYRFVGDTATGAPFWGYRDSGVMFHSQSPQALKADQGFPVCLEYNLHGGDGTNERPTGQVCLPGTTVLINGEKNEDFCTNPTVQRTFHGDQWVTLEIDVQDEVITYFVNGEEILSYSDPRFDPANEHANALIIDGKDEVRSGYIALQSNSHPIDFRNIELMEY